MPTVNQIIKQTKKSLKKSPKSKYNNKKTVVDGITFDSKKEAKRYGELKLRERAKEIRNLRLKTRYELKVNEILICRYEDDFNYDDDRILEHVVEDVKGVRTREYILKKKLMLAVYGIEIKEV